MILVLFVFYLIYLCVLPPKNVPKNVQKHPNIFPSIFQPCPNHAPQTSPEISPKPSKHVPNTFNTYHKPVPEPPKKNIKNDLENKSLFMMKDLALFDLKHRFYTINTPTGDLQTQGIENLPSIVRILICSCFLLKTCM